MDFRFIMLHGRLEVRVEVLLHEGVFVLAVDDFVCFETWEILVFWISGFQYFLILRINLRRWWNHWFYILILIEFTQFDRLLRSIVDFKLNFLSCKYWLRFLDALDIIQSFLCAIVHSLCVTCVFSGYYLLFLHILCCHGFLWLFSNVLDLIFLRLFG